MSHPVVLDGSALKNCYKQAAKVGKEGKDRRQPLPSPSDDTCEFQAKAISEQARLLSETERKSLGTALSQLRKVRKGISRLSVADPSVLAALESAEKKISAQLDYDWTQVAGCICAWGMNAWEQLDRPLMSVNTRDPLCIFTHLVLKELGMRPTAATVSMALRGRRGSRARMKGRTK
jgi:hypothetical protein